MSYSRYINGKKFNDAPINESKMHIDILMKAVKNAYSNAYNNRVKISEIIAEYIRAALLNNTDESVNAVKNGFLEYLGENDIATYQDEFLMLSRAKNEYLANGEMAEFSVMKNRVRYFQVHYSSENIFFNDESNNSYSVLTYEDLKNAIIDNLE